MISTNYIVAVDIGTTSTKTVIFDQDGHFIIKASLGYPMYSPQPSWSEQDPNEIFSAVINGIKQTMNEASIFPEQIIGVSFSSAMHSIIAMDENGNNLTQCITWADNRSSKYTEKLKTELNGYEIYKRTGTPLHPMAPLSKILWFKNEAEDIYIKTSKWISIKEFIFYKLFGKYVIDYSIASATGIFNLTSLDWDQEALEVLGIDKNQLSEPVPTTYQVTGLKEEWQQELGITNDTPFIIGASDGVLANLGVGAIDDGITAISIGTSGAVRQVVRQPVTDEKGRIFCYALTDDLWVIGGAINNGGIVNQWLRDELATLESEKAKELGIEPYLYLSKLAEEVNAGSDGLLFLPYLTGERAPHWDSNARGVFFGLSLHHQKAHMIRASLEGVIFQLFQVLEILEEKSVQSVEIRANGGFAKSALWSQMMADVFGIKVRIPEVYESSAYGAAKLGLYSLGIISTLLESENTDSMKEFIPNSENHVIYKKLYPIFSGLYTKLKDDFEKIVSYQT